MRDNYNPTHCHLTISHYKEDTQHDNMKHHTQHTYMQTVVDHVSEHHVMTAECH